MQGFSDSRLKWSTELLRLVLEMGCEVAQTCMRRGVPQTSVGWDAELLRLVLNAGLLRPASEISMLFLTRGPRFNQNATFVLK